MWVLLWGSHACPTCPRLPRDSLIPPHTYALPLSNCTALTAMCPLPRAFQAGGAGAGHVGSPGNPAGACAFSLSAGDSDMFRIHLQMRTLAQSHQRPHLIGRAPNFQGGLEEFRLSA